jgi:tripartite-type tricarboxylate transporter receptor subunit TctC
MKYAKPSVAGLCGALVAALAFAATPAAAQAQPEAEAGYPSKPIHLVVPFPGVVENLARAIGHAITAETGQPVVVEPRSGANGIVAAQAVARQPPDGYTILFTTNTTHAGNPTIYAKLPYDPVKDFAPVAAVVKGALLYVGSPKLAASNISEVVELARKNPGKLTFGWAGSSGRAAIEMLNIAANLKMRNVPYKSAPQALTDLVSGQIDLLVYGDLSTGLQFAKAGKLRLLGVSTADRLAIAPDVPTVREQGFPDFEMTFWAAAYAPAGTPAPVVHRLNELIASAMHSERVRELVQHTGLIPYVTSPEGLAQFQAAETDKWRRIVTAAGMQETQ